MNAEWIGLAVVVVIVVAVAWWKNRSASAAVTAAVTAFGAAAAPDVAAAAAAASALAGSCPACGPGYVTWLYHDNAQAAPQVQCPAGKKLSVLSAFYGSSRGPNADARAGGTTCGFVDVTGPAAAALSGQGSHQFASIGTELASYNAAPATDPCRGTVKRFTGVAACV